MNDVFYVADGNEQRRLATKQCHPILRVPKVFLSFDCTAPKKTGDRRASAGGLLGPRRVHRGRRCQGARYAYYRFLVFWRVQSIVQKTVWRAAHNGLDINFASLLDDLFGYLCMEGSQKTASNFFGCPALRHPYDGDFYCDLRFMR